MYFQGVWYETDENDDLDEYDYSYEEYLSDIPDGTPEGYKEFIADEDVQTWLNQT